MQITVKSLASKAFDSIGIYDESISILEGVNMVGVYLTVKIPFTVDSD